MDNVKALGDAMLMHQPEDLRGHNSLHCGDGCAQEIVRHLYEAGFVIAPVSDDERAAVQTIAEALAPLSPESQRAVVQELVSSVR